jgi:hypothetical protein
MPATSIRDLVFKDADVVVGTHGRSFWILDDIAPLRQLTTAVADATLFKPEPAIRVRWDMNPDTPLPQEEPAGENPPDGAIIDYYLKADASDSVTLDIVGAAGQIIRHYSSRDTLYTIPDVNIPLYWIRPQQLLSSKAGAHRFIWDLHYQPLNVPVSYPISAVYANTAPGATSPWVMPGVYTIRLKANGKTYTQQLTVRMDPRVKTPVGALQQQHDLALQAYHGRQRAMAALDSVRRLRAQLGGINGAHVSDITRDLDSQLSPFEGSGRRGRGGAAPAATAPRSFSQLESDLAGIFTILEEADMPPTEQTVTALKATLKVMDATDAAFQQIVNRIHFSKE